MDELIKRKKNKWRKQQKKEKSEENFGGTSYENKIKKKLQIKEY